MELKKVIQWLLDNKYGIIVNNQFVLSAKLNKELFPDTIYSPPQESIQSTPITQATIPVIITDKNKKQIWNEFIERTNLPHRVKDGKGGVYTIRQFNLPAVNKLIEVINTPGIEYDRLVKSTKHYYATVTYKVLLSNYLLRDMWLDEYHNFGKSSQKIDDGSSKWED